MSFLHLVPPPQPHHPHTHPSPCKLVSFCTEGTPSPLKPPAVPCCLQVFLQKSMWSEESYLLPRAPSADTQGGRLARKPVVSEAQLGDWQGMSPTYACGLIKSCFLFLGAVGGGGAEYTDVCPQPCVLQGCLGAFGIPPPLTSCAQVALLERTRGSLR